VGRYTVCGSGSDCRSDAYGSKGSTPLLPKKEVSMNDETYIETHLANKKIKAKSLLRRILEFLVQFRTG
jgi:hypothetical protein